MPFRPNSSELSKNNARNIKYMPALILESFRYSLQHQPCLLRQQLL